MRKFMILAVLAAVAGLLAIDLHGVDAGGSWRWVGGNAATGKGGGVSADGPGAHQAPLSTGWDTSGPLSMGKVIWNVADGQGLKVTYILSGAQPNHAYQVGAHFFNYPLSTNDPGVHDFGPGATWIAECPAGGCQRDGVWSGGDAIEFGVLETDSNGDGAVHFNLSPPTGTYYAQFTVRIGVGCGLPDFVNCSVVYRTGSVFATGLETIIIP